MAEDTGRRSLPGLTGIIAGGVVILGVALWMFVNKGLLIVAGIGVFAPGFLREFGWLRDHDEFQRQAARRAGYHAYLVGGLAAVLVYSALEWWDGVDVSSEWVLLVLLTLWMAWLFSSLLAYWGARRTATRVLIVFGSFWAVFAIATIISEANLADDPGMSVIGLLAGFALVGPFFVLAWAAGRWPRVTGFLLVAVSVLFLYHFFPSGGNMKWSTVLLTDALLLVPLAASGIALLREGAGEAEAP